MSEPKKTGKVIIGKLHIPRPEGKSEPARQQLPETIKQQIIPPLPKPKGK